MFLEEERGGCFCTEGKRFGVDVDLIRGRGVEGLGSGSSGIEKDMDLAESKEMLSRLNSDLVAVGSGLGVMSWRVRVSLKDWAPKEERS